MTRGCSIETILSRGIELGAYPGATLVVMQGRDVIADLAIGTLDGERRVTSSTLYDLASLTKPIATAAVLSDLLRNGDILLSQTVGEILGPDAGRLKSRTIFQLLTHTSGLLPHIPCYDYGLGLDSAVDAIVMSDIEPAGTLYRYSCLGYIVLAKIIKVVTGQSLDVAARQRCWDSLSLKSFTYKPTGLVAPTRSLEGPQGDVVELIGVVHDGNARGIAAGGCGDVSGNAGCFGTARDVAAIGRSVLSGAWLGMPLSKRWLCDQSQPGGHSLAFFAGSNPLVPKGEIFGEDAIGHSGYTGTALLLLPNLDAVIALCSNAVYADKETFLLHRRRIMNVVAAHLKSP
ncbi:MAG: serine hydrolase domain-containing protein [Armatimonadota bacterium]